MPIARTWSRRSIRPSIAAGFAASGICRSQVEPGLTGFLPALRQRIKPLPLVGRQPIGQPALDLPPRLMADIDTKPFQALRRAGRQSAVDGTPP